MESRVSSPPAVSVSDAGSPGPRSQSAVRRSNLARELARKYLVVALLPLLIILFTILAPGTFATLVTLQSLLTVNALLLILAVGQTIVLVVGEFDFSFAGLVGMAACVVAAAGGVPMWVALLLSLAACLAIGAINAFFVVGLGVNSLITTLGMGTVTTGIGLAVSNSSTLPNPHLQIDSAVQDTIGGIGIPFFVALVALVLLWGVLERTKVGRNAYVVGAGRRAAAYAGIKVNRARTIAFLLSAVTAWLGGVFILGQSGSAVANIGTGDLLPVIAAVLLGYTAIRPGRYNALGSLVGVFVLAVGSTGIEVMAAPSWITDVFSGGVLFVAVATANVIGSTRGLRALRSVLE